jgi:hypothetical protein
MAAFISTITPAFLCVSGALTELFFRTECSLDMSDTRPPPVVVANHFQTPYNYKVLLGANVACFTDDGEYAGYNGVVHCVNFSATVALDQSESNVAFDIWLGPGVFQMWKPIQLYRKSSGFV